MAISLKSLQGRLAAAKRRATKAKKSGNQDLIDRNLRILNKLQGQISMFEASNSTEGVGLQPGEEFTEGANLLPVPEELVVAEVEPVEAVEESFAGATIEESQGVAGGFTVVDPNTGKRFSTESAKGQEIMEEQGLSLPGAEAPADVEVTPEGLTDAELDAQAQSEIDLFGEASTPSSMEELVDQFIETQEQESAFFDEQAATSQFLSEASASDQRNQLEMSQQVAEQSLFAGGREGPTSSTAGAAATRLEGAMQGRIDRVIASQDSAKADLDQMRVELQQAQADGRADLAAGISAQMEAKQFEIDQLEVDQINALTAATELDFKIRESEVNIQTTKGATVRESIAALGSVAGDLTVTQLATMIEGSDITLPEALLLQQATVLQGEVDNAKNEADALRAQADLDTVIAEIDQIGKTNDTQTYEYYNALSEQGQKDYIKFQNATTNSQIVQGADGNYFAFDPATNEVTLLDTGVAGEFTPADIDMSTYDLEASGSNSILSYIKIFPGSSANAEGVDFAASIGTAVSSNISGEVVGVSSTCSAGEQSCNSGWGNQVKVKDSNGNIHTFNHLSGIADGLAVGSSVGVGTSLGLSGNTGRVLGGSGEELSQAQIDSGRGAHLDYTVLKPDGSRYDLGEAMNFAFGQEVAGSAGYDTSTFGGTLASQFEQDGIDFGYEDEALQDYVDTQIKQAEGGMTGEQGKAYNAYITMKPENELWNSKFDELDDAGKESLADEFGALNRYVKDADAGLTGDAFWTYLNKYAKSDEGRLMFNSSMRWLEAALRHESGAAINAGEYSQKINNFFPMPGETAEEIAIKSTARDTSLEGKYGMMGGGGQATYLKTTFGAEETFDVEAAIDKYDPDTYEYYQKYGIIPTE